MNAASNRAKSIYLNAVEIASSDEREAYLALECRKDAGLRREVEELLAHHEPAQGFLESKVVVPLPTQTLRAERSLPEDAPSAVVGPYKLLQKIGEGGMGTVYMAEQTEPVKRKVALKIIKPGMDSRQVIARFEAERQALAMMDHPNIARVLDAGTTPPPSPPFQGGENCKFPPFQGGENCKFPPLQEGVDSKSPPYEGGARGGNADSPPLGGGARGGRKDSSPSEAGAGGGGRPYFVMELVCGIPITDYCDKNQLSPKKRLELFIPICQAIQHAHQKGIIHRDLKPSNVLVCQYDGKPVPKVIDFGVAKAMGHSLTERTLFTEFGQVVGTLEYMSPEQAELNQLDVDTRSDVYSLGVMLYELLTGSTPLNRQQLKGAAILELLCIIREEEPPRPSTRLSTSAELPAIAAHRQTEPAKLAKQVRGELDWIVMKALEKDRQRRYETASALAADLQRYLADEKVEACPPSWGYRVRKFARRNQALLAGAACIVMALLAGTTVAAWQALRATEAQRRTQLALDAENAARSLAQKRATETEAVLDFVENKVLSAARPEGQEGGLGRDVSLRAALEQSLTIIDESFADEPLIEARLRLTLGRTFYYLGDAKAAREQFEKARQLYETHLGRNHPITLRTFLDVSNAYEAQGRYAAALELREQTLEAQQQVLGPNHADVRRTQLNLANSYADLGRLHDALRLREELLVAARRERGPENSETLQCMNNLALSYHALGRHEAALALRDKVLAIRLAKVGPRHPDTLRCQHNLANSYHAMGLHEEALHLRERTLAIREDQLGADHPDTLASMDAVAASYRALGRDDEALQLRERLVARAEAKLGPDHPETLRIQNNLANGYHDAGRLQEALKLREETLKRRLAQFGREHPDSLNAMENLAISHFSLQRYDEALALRQDVLTSREALIGRDHPDTLRAMRNLAISLFQANRDAQAVAVIDECIKRGADKVTDPRVIPGVLVLRLEHFQKSRDGPGCRRTAETWESLQRTDGDSLYAAAGMRAVTAAVFSAAGSPGQSNREAEAEAECAMSWLRQAIAAGCDKAIYVAQDANFAALHDREDFRQLVAQVEANRSQQRTSSGVQRRSRKQ